MNQDDNNLKPEDLASGTDAAVSSQSQKKSNFYKTFKSKNHFENYVKNLVKTKESEILAKDEQISKLNKKMEAFLKTKKTDSKDDIEKKSDKNGNFSKHWLV